MARDLFPVRTRTGYRRAFWISMGVSAVVHLLAVVLYPSLVLNVPAGVLEPGAECAASTLRGMELLNLTELTQEEYDALPPEEREEEREVVAEEEARAVRGGEPAREGEVSEEGREGERLPSNAELFRPGRGDLRLWAPPDPELNQTAVEDLMRLRLLWELEDLSDSAAVAEELARRALDWTYTDSEGKRWGVSPGKLHLGDVTLPLPFGFGAPPAVREQNQDRVWQWEDIQRGMNNAAVRESWKERNEAIRRRKEAERKPDTTGIRR